MRFEIVASLQLYRARNCIIFHGPQRDNKMYMYMCTSNTSTYCIYVCTNEKKKNAHIKFGKGNFTYQAPSGGQLRRLSAQKEANELGTKVVKSSTPNGV